MGSAGCCQWALPVDSSMAGTVAQWTYTDLAHSDDPQWKILPDALFFVVQGHVVVLVRGNDRFTPCIKTSLYKT